MDAKVDVPQAGRDQHRDGDGQVDPAIEVRSGFRLTRGVVRPRGFLRGEAIQDLLPQFRRGGPGAKLAQLLFGRLIAHRPARL